MHRINNVGGVRPIVISVSESVMWVELDVGHFSNYCNLRNWCYKPFLKEASVVSDSHATKVSLYSIQCSLLAVTLSDVPLYSCTHR